MRATGADVGACEGVGVGVGTGTAATAVAAAAAAGTGATSGAADEGGAGAGTGAGVGTGSRGVVIGIGCLNSKVTGRTWPVGMNIRVKIDEESTVVVRTKLEPRSEISEIGSALTDSLHNGFKRADAGSVDTDHLVAVVSPKR